MNIYTKKAVVQSIPIVPMLDILTILLIFFIVHTEFKRQSHVLKLEVPQTRHIAGESGDPNQVLLEVGADGNIALGGKTLDMNELPDAVREIQRNAPDSRVQVSASEGASMGRFIEVLDTLTAAGLSVDEVPIHIRYKP